MDEQNVVYPDGGTLLASRQESTTDVPASLMNLKTRCRATEARREEDIV